MSILEIVCGTGGWTGPKPGDPDSSLLLRATPAFGGIDITISYPTTNPHALSHTILYRGLTPNFSGAIRLTEFSGTFYHDRMDNISPVTYYYWATTVSVNGTIGELLGPASAMARPRIEDYIEALTGKIDSGLLARALKTKIDRIDWLEDGITKVENYAKNSEEALASMITGIQASLGEATSLVLEEISVRSTENSSLSERVTTVQAQLDDKVASVEQYMGAYITKTDGSIEGLGGSLSNLEDDLLEGMETMGTIYTVKLQAGDLIGGFGMVNDSKFVEAGFDVDRFWVGRTTNKRKPFIIEGGEVVIDQAVINKLTFSKLRDERGSFIVKDGKVKADYLEATRFTVEEADIANAAITNAKIGNAAITSAKIKNAEVGTLKIAGNAVIVPKLMTNNNVIRGSNSFVTLINDRVSLPYAGLISIQFSARQGYSTQVGTHFTISLNGSQLYSGASGTYQDFVNITLGRFVNAGSHTVLVRWNGAPQVTVASITAVVQGVMR